MLVLGLMGGGWLHAQPTDTRPRAWVPASAGTLVERLPRGYAALMPTARSPASQPTSSLQQAERLLSTAAVTGDSRLAARAAGMLARLGDGDDPALLRARAFSAQHQHAFADAVALLDRAIALDPRDGSARLSRAQVQLVRGNLDLARADCTALILGVDAGGGTLCVAMLTLRRGQFDDAAKLTDRWLVQSMPGDPLRRFALLLRGRIASRARDPAADGWFREALALDPRDVRTLVAYARHLRATDRPSDVLALLAEASDGDAVALQRTLALHALDDPAAAAAIERQARRYRLSRALGSEPELRDEAEVLLLRGDAAALALAQRNFITQRDHEDVNVLLRAAAAAKQPEALHDLRAWAAAQQIDPAIDGDRP